MRKITTGFVAVLFICLMSMTDLSAQAFAKENFVANAGIGVGGGGRFTGGSSGVGISVSLEKGFMETGDFGIIGIGGNVGYRTNSLGVGNYNTFLIGPRGTYHFSIIPVEQLDVYAAVQTDIVFISGDFIASDTDIDVSLIAAARYYFSENFGAFVEAGINSYSALTGGISYKF